MVHRFFLRSASTLASRAAGARPVWKVKQTFYHRLWNSLTARRWDEFDRVLRAMRYFRPTRSERGLRNDEVTYTLKAHFFILNPHVAVENVGAAHAQSFLVLEEMKRALAHPAVIRMNEVGAAHAQHLINSYFELEELGCEPPRTQWQNFAKMVWQTALRCAALTPRLNRQRRHALRRRLLLKDPEDVMRISARVCALNAQDIEAMALAEFDAALVTPLAALDEAFDEPIEVDAARFVPLAPKRLDFQSEYALSHLRAAA